MERALLNLNRVDRPDFMEDVHYVALEQVVRGAYAEHDRIRERVIKAGFIT